MGTAVPQSSFAAILLHMGSSFVNMQGRGTLALPADLRRRHGLDEPGAQLEIVERDDGVIELRPHVPVPADQAWFWTQRWQDREREVDAQVEAGEVTTHDSVDDFLSHLDALDSE
jgi:bifunctional DNA-binding transcriptional regulator/antitoxin component of YhaV-PrlF toxin-antitoxin module